MQYTVLKIFRIIEYIHDWCFKLSYFINFSKIFSINHQLNLIFTRKTKIMISFLEIFSFPFFWLRWYHQNSKRWLRESILTPVIQGREEEEEFSSHLIPITETFLSWKSWNLNTTFYDIKRGASELEFVAFQIETETSLNCRSSLFCAFFCSINFQDDHQGEIRSHLALVRKTD